MNHLETVRSILSKNLTHYELTPQEIEDSTFTGQEDPGGWARRAHVVVHCESGIPSVTFDEYPVHAWDLINDDLNALGLFAEPVNSAVVAIYSI
jgi:hypothetical protein